jgi:hypothetical protein
MAKSWNEMTYHEKLENLRQGMVQIHAALNAFKSDLDHTWSAMRGTRLEVDKITKDVATLKALWPKNYSRAG